MRKKFAASCSFRNCKQISLAALKETWGLLKPACGFPACSQPSVGVVLFCFNCPEGENLGSAGQPHFLCKLRRAASRSFPCSSAPTAALRRFLALPARCQRRMSVWHPSERPSHEMRRHVKIKRRSGSSEETSRRLLQLLFSTKNFDFFSSKIVFFQLSDINLQKKKIKLDASLFEDNNGYSLGLWTLTHTINKKELTC